MTTIQYKKGHLYFKTQTAMVATLAVFDEGDTIECGAKSADFDNGGGVFTVKDTSLTPADGVNIIALGGGSKFAIRNNPVVSPAQAGFGSGTGIIYVATSGDDTQTGFDAAKPVKTIQRAVDVLLANTDGGKWKISISAGTYAERVTVTASSADDLPRSNKRVIISGVDVGASPAVPTVIIDGSTLGGTGTGMQASGPVFLRVEDVKIIDFDQNGAIGFHANNGAILNLHNCHADNDADGVKSDAGSEITIEGGIFNACGRGISAINGSTVNIGHLTAISITACTVAGILFQRGTSGVVQSTTIDGSSANIGIQIDSGSNLNAFLNTIQNCTTGILVQTKATLTELGGANTYTSNTTDIDEKEAASADRSLLIDLVSANAAAFAVSPIDVKSFAMPNDLMGVAGRKLEVYAAGDFDATIAGGNITIGLAIGGADVAAAVRIAGANSGHWELKGEVFAVSSTSQRSTVKLTYSLSASTSAAELEYGATSTTLTGVRTVKLTMQGSAGDTISVDIFEIKIIR